MSRSDVALWARGPLVWLGIALWAATVVGGFAWLTRYKSTPGASADGVPVRWPAASAVSRDPARPTLVLFAHPHCPCSRASVSELARLMAVHASRAAVRVVVLKPGDVAEGWERTDLWRTAVEIAGPGALVDVDGREAVRFGAKTSGQVLLYDRDGRLLFNGGITASRGHEGDSFGRRRIVSFLTTGTADRATSPVFGCALGAHTEAAAGRKEHGS